mmetsp:Transcript_109817/g.309645  ORF Transcript_109817/g.309645 Transcript_109817/m.309645 type:complete len:389 (-) Transcript_109817:75-1241(-)
MSDRGAASEPAPLRVSALLSCGRLDGYKVVAKVGQQHMNIWPSGDLEQESGAMYVPPGAPRPCGGGALSPPWLSSVPPSPARSMLQSWAVVGYKVVAKLGQRYFSIWAGREVEYVLGVSMRDDAEPGRVGGLYACNSPKSAVRHFISVSPHGLHNAPRALLLCSCAGPIVNYESGKAACSCLTPIEEVPMPKATPRGGAELAQALLGRSTPSRRRRRASDGRSQNAQDQPCAMQGWSVLGFAVRAAADQQRPYADLPDGCLHVCPSPSSTLWAFAPRAVDNDHGDHNSSPAATLLWCICGGPFTQSEGMLLFSRLRVLGEGRLPEATPSSVFRPRVAWPTIESMHPSYFAGSALRTLGGGPRSARGETYGDARHRRRAGSAPSRARGA